MNSNGRLTIHKKTIECYWPHNVKEINATFLKHNGGYYLNKLELQNFAERINNALKYYDEVGIDNFNVEIKQEREEEMKQMKLEYKKSINEPKIRKPQKGFVYFITDNTGLTKIGLAKNIEKRLKGLKIGNPTLELIYHVNSNDMALTEELFHEKFKKKRIKGEWFDLNQSDIAYIKNGKYSPKIKSSIKGIGD